jgi:hypothetical protein
MSALIRRILAVSLSVSWLMICATVLSTTRAELIRNGLRDGVVVSMPEAFLSLSPTAWTAILTVGLMFAACVQALIYWEMHVANRTIERPYVSMSHEPPGIQFVPPDGPPTAIQASIKITNTGHTPADILEMRWVRALSRDELLAERDHEPPPRNGSVVLSLMPNDSFHYWQHIADIDPNVLAAIQAGGQPLWLVGSVTYLDRFDRSRRHRNGYGRRFIHQVLPAVITTLSSCWKTLSFGNSIAKKIWIS